MVDSVTLEGVAANAVVQNKYDGIHITEVVEMTMALAIGPSGEVEMQMLIHGCCGLSAYHLNDELIASMVEGFAHIQAKRDEIKEGLKNVIN